MADKQASTLVDGLPRRRMAALVTGVVVFVIGAALVLAPLLNTDGAQSAAQVPRPSATTTPTAAAPTDRPLPKPNSLQSALSLRVLFGTQSIGSDIAKGVPAAFAQAKLPKPRVVKWSSARRFKGPILATATIGQTGDPRSKFRSFANLVNGAPRGSIRVAVMAFNYQDVSAETDVDALFQNYVETMDSLETANPDVTLIYSTVPITGSNSWREVDAGTVEWLSGVTQPVWQENIARERFNTLVRQQYGESGRLFDIAALEARVGKGKVAAKQHEGQWYHVLSPALSSDGRRLNAEGSRQLASELLKLIAAVPNS